MFSAVVYTLINIQAAFYLLLEFCARIRYAFGISTCTKKQKFGDTSDRKHRIIIYD